MKVFLSWSGTRSKAVADTLGQWLAQVIQAVEPWISSEIEKGTRGASAIAESLENAKVGIICLTADNLDARWILFEAGALSKTKDSHVCTFLLDHSPADIEPPLGQFQHTIFAKDDIHKLVRTVNNRLEASGGKPLSESKLSTAFETYWPQLEKAFSEIKAKKYSEPVQRPEREILEEMLEILRGLRSFLASPWAGFGRAFGP